MTLHTRPDPEWLPAVWAALDPEQRAANYTTRSIGPDDLDVGLLVVARDRSMLRQVATWHRRPDGAFELSLSDHSHAVWPVEVATIIVAVWRRLTRAQLDSLDRIASQSYTPVRNSVQPDEHGTCGVTPQTFGVLVHRGLAHVPDGGARSHRGAELTEAGEAVVLAHTERGAA